MIRVVKEGSYKLIETKHHVHILTLDAKHKYAWINTDGIGEILVATFEQHTTDHMLSVGRYRIYSVDNEPALTDMSHLELHVGNGSWQGYLLPTGLPTKKDKKNRIIPTNETITKSLL